VLLAGLFLILPPQTLETVQEFGAEINPTGNPVGGGQGYNKIISAEQATFLVRNKTELLSALAAVSPGQIIYIDDNVKIDLSGENRIKIPANITLASGRGLNGSKGGMLFTRSQNVRIALLLVDGDNIRITGLRLNGPDTEMGDHAYGGIYKLGDGISSAHTNLEVDNCEIFGWGHAGVYLTSGPQYAYIHHNYIHHNRRYGLGYGVCLGYCTDANPIFSLIEGNLFDNNRHHIAGTGTPGNSYEARYNICLTFDVGHCFDMHGGADRDDGTDIAGNSIIIHHNTFRDPQQNAVCIRGIPQNEAQIYNNWFYHEETAKAVRQLNATGNMFVSDNFLGSAPPAGTTLPVPVITASSQIGVSPLKITFDGSGITGLTAPLVSWHWKFGDGNSDTGAEADGQQVQYTFKDPGRYNVMLTVADTRGIPMNSVIPVTVTPADRAILSFWIKDSFRENTPGYFRKEILLDDVIVWQEDIAGDQQWEHVCVDVTDRVFNKASVNLALRVTCLRNIRFPDPVNLYTYDGLLELFVFWDDVTLFGFEVTNGDFESAGSWFYSEGNGTLPSSSIYSGDARSGYKSYMLSFPYMGEPNAGAWAQVAQKATNQPPSVLEHRPDSFQVQVNPEVTVTFSEPMHRKSAEDAFSIVPYHPGKFQWDGNKMIFLPDGYLSPGKHYTISINTTATDLAGKPLQSVHSWHFITFPESPIAVCPNPWLQSQSSGSIQFSNLPRQCVVEIYDMSGKLIISMEHPDSDDGGREEWSPNGVSGGVYLYRVRQSSGTLNGKFIIVK
jgi:PKD repeat protein